MGKVDLFTISLQKANPIYFSGEAVTGTLHVRVKEKLKINCLQMVLSGSARVHWTESHGSGKNRRTRSYSAYEHYLSINVILLAKPANSDLYMEVGDYSYPFSVVLPPNLPTSFEHNIGRIRYSIRGTIDIPWAFDKHTSKSFSVLNHYDLNYIPTLRQAAGVSDQKVLCCCCCKSEPIKANFALMKTGYVPGEGIVFNASIDNNTSREIKEMSVSLIQSIRFITPTKSKTISRNIAVIKYPKRIGSFTKESWDNSILVIPPVCPTSNGSSRIIEVSYMVLFNFDASGMAVSTDMRIPIVVGTIPLRVEGMPMPDNPISYEACMFGPNPNTTLAESEAENKGEMLESDENTFKPFYPFYRDYSLNRQH